MTLLIVQAVAAQRLRVCIFFGNTWQKESSVIATITELSFDFAGGLYRSDLYLGVEIFLAG